MYFSQMNISPGKENIIDPNLEKYDPTPNIFDLFRQFNVRFFWDKLNMVEVSWSGRQMTSCAGICSFQPKSGYCSIRLSAPLLSLRPRKDLVETLLHEMIHAYLFITKNYRDRNDHGPEFHKHMNRINREAGTNISVYHTFLDEVAHYKTHVWRCNGPCQKTGPFFGFVRRATGRAPSANDKWWDTHKSKCSGTFEKIEEPPGYKARGKKNIATKVPKEGASNDLRNYFDSTRKAIGGGANIHTFGDLNAKKSPSANIQIFGDLNAKKSPSPNIHIFGSPRSSGGMMRNKVVVTSVAGGKSANNSKSFPASPPSHNTPSQTSKLPSNSQVNLLVRNVWAQKYPETIESSNAKRKMETSTYAACKKKVSEFEDCKQLTDDRSSSHSEVCTFKKLPCPVCTQLVLNGTLENHLSTCLSDSITEDIFCADDAEIVDISDDETDSPQTVACPICAVFYLETKINSHIDECLNLKAIANGNFDS